MSIEFLYRIVSFEFEKCFTFSPRFCLSCFFQPSLGILRYVRVCQTGLVLFLYRVLEFRVERLHCIVLVFKVGVILYECKVRVQLLECDYFVQFRLNDYSLLVLFRQLELQYLIFFMKILEGFFRLRIFLILDLEIIL